MAEFDMIPLSEGNLTFDYEPKNIGLIMQETFVHPVTRIPKVYNQYKIIPLFYRVEDELGNEVDFKREVREWDIVLPFGVDSKTPRRNPTELNYKGKRLKNKFMD